MKQLKRRRVRKNSFSSLLATVYSLVLEMNLLTIERITPIVNSTSSNRNITLKLSKKEG